ncbi:MAG: hypothetical protein HY303_01715, partial [Candidatus Wallbacteria bacterium]|nr:hypothetical protein [Candidatus Wallbacteria bacterium]
MSGLTPFYAGNVTNSDSRFWSEATYTVTSSTADAGFVPVTNQRRTAIKHHEHANEFTQAGHYAAGLHCWSCHDPHGTLNKANLLLPDGNLIVNEQINSRSLCLSCHGPAGSAPSQFRFTSVANLRNHFEAGISSHQDPAIEALFSCTKCHMPKTAQTVEKYDMHSHTFQAIDPQVSLNTGLAGGGDSRRPAGSNGNNADPSRRGNWTYDRTAVLPNACVECHASRLDSLASLRT